MRCYNYKGDMPKDKNSGINKKLIMMITVDHGDGSLWSRWSR